MMTRCIKLKHLLLLSAALAIAAWPLATTASASSLASPTVITWNASSAGGTFFLATVQYPSRRGLGRRSIGGECAPGAFRADWIGVHWRPEPNKHRFNC